LYVEQGLYSEILKVFEQWVIKHSC
jgi:hypothetical protein